MDPIMKKLIMAFAPVLFDYLEEVAEKTETEIDDDLIEALRGPLLDLIGRL